MVVILINLFGPIYRLNRSIIKIGQIPIGQREDMVPSKRKQHEPSVE